MERLVSTLNKLSEKSKEQYHRPYDRFEWPETISKGSYWFSPELMSTYSAECSRSISQDQAIELSKWEMINFLSLNIHGIKDLLFSVIDLIHTDDFRESSPYFHHFIDEENNHMWFFAEFCTRYAHKIYDSKRLTLKSFEATRTKNYVTFSRILIFERMVAYYNGAMMKDERLDAIIRDLNRMHFQEESRHLAMGHEMIRTLGEALLAEQGEQDVDEVHDYLRDYAKLCVASFYNPAMYRDAGFEDAYGVRRALLADAARQCFNEELVDYSLRPFAQVGRA